MLFAQLNSTHEFVNLTSTFQHYGVEVSFAINKQAYNIQASTLNYVLHKENVILELVKK